MNANNCTIAGFTTGPAELKNINGRGLCEFTIAYNRKAHVEGQPGEVDFIQVKVWGRNAEPISRELRTKGVPLVVVGPIRQDRWEDKVTGDTKSRITIEGYIVARQILAPKKEGTP